MRGKVGLMQHLRFRTSQYYIVTGLLLRPKAVKKRQVEQGIVSCIGKRLVVFNFLYFELIPVEIAGF